MESRDRSGGDGIRTPSSRAGWSGWWIPAAVVLVLVLFGLFARSPLTSPAGGRVPAGVSLGFPVAYLVLAPLCGTLDALSLLGLGEHVALLVTVIFAYAVWRFVRGRRGRSTRRMWIGEAAGAAILLAAIGVVYGGGMLVPRPMAFLRVENPDLVTIDFHSHTSRSHDGRSDFSAPANRAWHREAGYDVAYITDHTYADTAVAAAARNPSKSGEGTVLLPGREFVYRHEHVVALDTRGPVHAKILIQTLPDSLWRVPAPGPHGERPVNAIEIVDSSPKGLAKADNFRKEIFAIADSLNLALVAGSNNHGWSWTAAAWNVMSIPGWRQMPPHRLFREIESRLSVGRHAPVQVVARSRIHEGAPVLLALTVPRLVWHLLRTLTWPERVSWIVWTLALSVPVLLWRRRSSERPS